MENTKKFIIKANGDAVAFSRKKVVDSLLRSGASKKTAEDISFFVEERIGEGTPSKDIYGWAFAELKKRNERPVAARYSLKNAIMELGSSGYPFESFVAEILKKRGYKTRVGVTLQGKCVSHEVDVVAVKGDKHYLIEAKFHNRHGYQTNVKVPLYIRSRFLDLEASLKEKGDKHTIHQSWIVTNTRFTKDAIRYGECMDMKMIGWRYPQEGGLEKLVEEVGLQPITCLISLTKFEKKKLLDNRIVLCSDAAKNPDLLRKLGFSEKRIEALTSEVESVAGSYSS